jgi:CelD/BcsL family acetyltransferase involved in cellulose biosynthesis
MEQIPEDPELRCSWNKLALGMERPEVFYTYEWAIAVQHAYRDSIKPLLFLAYEEESLVGLAALATKKEALAEVVFLAADTADYCDFLSTPDSREELVQAVLSQLKARDIAKVTLTNLPADSSSTKALSRAASIHRYHWHSREAYLCARVIVSSAEEREAVKHSVAKKKRLRRNMRELEKRGVVRIQHDVSWSQIAPLLQPFSRTHVARFFETGRISNLIRDERRVFLGELAKDLSSSGWIAMSRLLVGEVTAAWNYGFKFAGTWFWYQPTVDFRYAEFSPGYCLLAKIIELACVSPEINVVDLGLGAEEYKERFSTASRRTLYCALNASFLAHLRTVLRNRAVEVARTSPWTEKAIRLTISRIAGLRERFQRTGFWDALAWTIRRVGSSLFALEDVLFFEWPEGGQTPKGSSNSLCRLDSELLGAAGIIYREDPAALRHFVRSAQRLKSEQDQGFALITAEGMPVHFCWVRQAEGFEMAELDRILHVPSDQAVLIFDCFTPVSARGHGFFTEAIAALGDHLRSQGRHPWIFGAAKNQASRRGIEKAGFTYRFTLGRKRILFISAKKDSIPSSTPSNSATSVSMR